MARITYVKSAQQRYETVPVIDPATGQQKQTPVISKRTGEQKVTKNGRPVFLRVTEVDKTRPKPNIVCEKCGTEIEPGMPYKHITPKSGPYGGRQRNRCMPCPTWRPSETTGSQHLAAIYGAQEAAEDSLAEWEADQGVDALSEILTALAEGLGEAVESYNESADNIEDGFGHETSMSAELREKAESVESAASDIESAADELEEFDEDAATDEAEGEIDEVDEDEIRADVENDWGDQIDDHDHSVVCGSSGSEHYLCSYNEREEAVAEAIKAAHAERAAEVEQAVTDKRDEWADEQRTIVEDAIQTDVGV
jgi:hypothetical protein